MLNYSESKIKEKDKRELINWMKFSKVRGIGSSKTIKLLGIFGNFNNLYNATDNELYRTRLFNEQKLFELRALKEEDNSMENFILEVCERENIEIIPLYSEEYPSNLKNLPDAPLTLYAQGNLKLLDTKKIAIVGSRESSDESLRWALKLSRDLVRGGITTVSGGAKGIDFQAHSAAVNLHGKTICVFGTGLLRLYPPENRGLFEKIKKNGLLLSEHPPIEKGSKLGLVRRNRIISGISDGIVIVTSAKAGGSRTQIEIANKQRIPSFVPKLSLKLHPQEGISDAVNLHKIFEIDNYVNLLDVLDDKTVSLGTQRTL